MATSGRFVTSARDGNLGHARLPKQPGILSPFVAVSGDCVAAAEFQQNMKLGYSALAGPSPAHPIYAR